MVSPLSGASGGFAGNLLRLPDHAIDQVLRRGPDQPCAVQRQPVMSDIDCGSHPPQSPQRTNRSLTQAVIAAGAVIPVSVLSRARVTRKTSRVLVHHASSPRPPSLPP